MVSTGNHTQVVFSGVDSVYIYIYPIGSMYGIYANIWGILMVNVTIYTIHGSYGYIYISSYMLYIYIIHCIVMNNLIN